MRPKAPVRMWVYTVATPGADGRVASPGVGEAREAIFFTPCPEWDAAFWQAQGRTCRWVAGPLYPEAAQALCRAWGLWAAGVLSGSFVRRWWARQQLRRRLGVELVFHRPIALQQAEVGVSETIETELADILPLISGRWLTWRELSALTARLGQSRRAQELSQVLQYGVVTGRVQVRAGLGWDEDGRAWQCGRCGARQRLGDEQGSPAAAAARARLTCPDCGRTGEYCLTCSACDALGPVRSCAVLYRAEVAPAPSLRLACGPKLSFELTPEQEKAAQELCRFCAESPARHGCVEAVCGAGKSEIVLAAMVQEWARGGRVLLAIPRREIVVELAARFRQYFNADANTGANVGAGRYVGTRGQASPTSDSATSADLPFSLITALYGGSGEIWNDGSRLTVATTHQTLRFDRTFDLTVLDEADAYPYHGTPLLEQAVERATRPDGKLIYLSATLSPSLLRTVQQEGGVHIRLVARPHGRALPEPVLVVGGSWQGKGDRCSGLQELWVRAAAGQPLFVFVPTVRMLKAVESSLRRLPALQRVSLASCHAHDPERESKCEQFRKGAVRVMVCTTLLERGVTIPQANVLVWAADEEHVFDTATLTQMAGRAGRSALGNPGLVVFWGRRRISRSMRQAVEAIRRANEQATAQGLLREPRGEGVNANHSTTANACSNQQPASAGAKAQEKPENEAAADRDVATQGAGPRLE